MDIGVIKGMYGVMGPFCSDTIVSVSMSCNWIHMTVISKATYVAYTFVLDMYLYNM